MVAAEAEVAVMTVECNGADLVFTPSSLSSAGMSDGQRGRIRQRGGGRGGKNKGRITETLKVCGIRKYVLRLLNKTEKVRQW